MLREVVIVNSEKCQNRSVFDIGYSTRFLLLDLHRLH